MSASSCAASLWHLLSSGTGEHGVGLGKKKYLTEELGEGTVAVMKSIKAALDPLNLLNPGKVRVVAWWVISD